jgi:hypothetical protein
VTIGEKEDWKMSKRIAPIGIIAEDDCDVACIRIFIHRIKSNERIGVKKFVGKGCGKIKRKANAWTNQLKTKGCKKLILVHDLDRNNLNELKNKINEAISPCPIKDYCICIPIEEMEAWFLSDTEAIQKSLNLPKKPSIRGNPENILSPKEKLGELVQRVSKNEKIYLNTKHNELIAKELSLNTVKDRCPSFKELYDFVEDKI